MFTEMCDRCFGVVRDFRRRGAAAVPEGKSKLVMARGRKSGDPYILGAYASVAGAARLPPSRRVVRSACTGVQVCASPFYDGVHTVY